MIFSNTLKERLAQNQVCVTTGLNFYAPELVEMLLHCGADAISLDAEHGAISESQIADMARVCELAAVPCVCRVPSERPEFIQRVLDGGVLGIVVPHVRSRSTTEDIVAAIKYPPQGRRGLGNFTRATGFGRIPSIDYLKKANRETFVTVQIEEPEGVEHVDSIVTVDGVDCIWIGYNDLAVSMGRPGGADHPDVQAAIEHVIAAARGAGRTVQVVARPEDAGAWIERGATLLSVGWSGFIGSTLRNQIDGIRRHSAPKTKIGENA